MQISSIYVGHARTRRSDCMVPSRLLPDRDNKIFSLKYIIMVILKARLSGQAGIIAGEIWLFSNAGVSCTAAVLADGTMDPLTSLFTGHSKST